MDGYGPIPNQRLKGALQVQLASGKQVVLPAGAFIKVIRREYVPKYHPFETYNADLYVVAHTQYGFALVPKYDIDWVVY